MKVFISHSQKDSDLAKKVADVLKEAGLDVWDYTNEILPGENWAEKISDALKESEAMVVLLTPEALESSNVQLEIGYALGNKTYDKRLIPVIVGNPDEMPSDKIPWILKRLRTISLSKQDINEEGIRQIATALKEVA